MLLPHPIPNVCIYGYRFLMIDFCILVGLFQLLVRNACIKGHRGKIERLDDRHMVEIGILIHVTP